METVRPHTCMTLSDGPESSLAIVARYFEGDFAGENVDISCPDRVLKEAGLDLDDAMIIGFDLVRDVQWDVDELLDGTTELGTARFRARAKVEGALSLRALQDLLAKTPYRYTDDSELVVAASLEVPLRIRGRVELGGGQDFDAVDSVEVDE